MSVVKNKRSLSRLEFYNTARKLRIDLTNWLLRDFGIRDKVYKFKNDDELEKTLCAEYPKWFIESTRKNNADNINKSNDEYYGCKFYLPDKHDGSRFKAWNTG